MIVRCMTYVHCFHFADTANDSQRAPTRQTGELNPPFKEIPISFPIISRDYRTINTTSSKVITDKLLVQ